MAGLTGVVISSARLGGPSGCRAALGAPRAVLWAEHMGSLNWPDGSTSQARTAPALYCPNSASYDLFIAPTATLLRDLCMLDMCQ